MATWKPEHFLILSLVVGSVPLLIAVGSCYLKFSIVLTLLKSGFGTQNAPSNSLVLALSLVLTFFVMKPVIDETATKMSSVQSASLERLKFIELKSELVPIIEPWRWFLEKHAGEREITFFERLALRDHNQRAEDLDKPFGPQQRTDLAIVLAAFVVSEIKAGFLIALVLLIPFLVIDLVVANLLVAMGFTLLSPVTVSLPIKLLLFVTCDGWMLLAKSFLSGYV